MIKLKKAFGNRPLSLPLFLLGGLLCIAAPFVAPAALTSAGISCWVAAALVAMFFDL